MIGIRTVTVLDHLLGSPRLYDRVQKIFGLDELRRRVGAALAQFEPGTLLDVGAGTANFYSVVPDDFEYIALDVDERKLSRVRQRFPDVRTVRGSGTDVPLGDASVDYTLCVDVSHHLDDDELKQLIHELARITGRKLLFVDALRVPHLPNRLFWALDRGNHPRPADALRRELGRHFALQRFETFKIHHVYAIAVAIPRPPKSDVPG
jgi:ubiquinone/menaquinone biosynthesis C-methylase UbiE